jgi:AbrB family looped-hinge helix DNA binding protein
MISVLRKSIDGENMSTVTISPKYQVVIPREIREKLGLKPGLKVHVLAFEGRIELIPVVPISDLRGFMQGIDTHIDREDDRV